MTLKGTISNHFTGWTSAIQSTERWLKYNWKVIVCHSYVIRSPFQTFRSTISWLNGRSSSCVWYKTCYFTSIKLLYKKISQLVLPFLWFINTKQIKQMMNTPTVVPNKTQAVLFFNLVCCVVSWRTTVVPKKMEILLFSDWVGWRG